MSFIIYKVCIFIKKCTRSYWNILSEVSVSQQCPPSCVQWEAMMGSSCGQTRANYCCMFQVRLLVFLSHLSDSLMMADIWCLAGQTIVSDSTHQKLVNIRQFFLNHIHSNLTMKDKLVRLDMPDTFTYQTIEKDYLPFTQNYKKCNCQESW